MKKNNQQGFTLLELIIAIVAIIGSIGWIMNIITILHTSLNPLTTELVLRFIGIPVAPLGAIMGYIP